MRLKWTKQATMTSTTCTWSVITTLRHGNQRKPAARSWCPGPLWVVLVWVLLGLCSAVTTSTAWNTTCPQKCMCSLQKSSRLRANLRTVDCSNKKLSAIPLDIPMDAEVILLKGNVIENLDRLNELPELKNLKELDLSYNRLRTFGQEPTFGNLTALHYLNLGRNQLGTLYHGSFSGLLRLDELVLSDNHLETIEDSAFGGLNHLRQLVLSNNRLARIQQDWFHSMAKLEVLMLDGNRVTEIKSETLSPLGQLSKLSLDRNQLTTVNKNELIGLNSLQTMDLGNNNFTAVPSSFTFQTIPSLKFLILDGNPIAALEAGSFEKLGIMEISLNSMPVLERVERNAFLNLHQLAILQMHDNRKLIYISPDSFNNVPALRVLFLHNNNLMAIPEKIALVSPRLKQISLYHNPVHCDCNVHWITQILTNHTNNTELTFPEADKFFCDSPPAVSGRLLREISVASIRRYCPPTVLPFFNESLQKELGGSVTYECRAIGVPIPHIHWILSNGKSINNTSNYSRIRLGKSGTLTLQYLKAQDAGTYTCVATNHYGFDTTSSILRIHSKRIQLLPMGIASTFITVTWNGSDATVAATNYQILYKKHGAKESYRNIHLGQYMRTYTVTRLKPQTTYEFCIAYKHQDEVHKISCVDIQTKQKAFIIEGITNIGSVTVVVAVLSALAVLTATCIALAILRRYKKRKAYKEPEGVNYQVGTLSHIPLDNLYHPPSTPLCSSRTSLIGQSKA